MELLRGSRSPEAIKAGAGTSFHCYRSRTEDGGRSTWAERIAYVQPAVTKKASRKATVVVTDFTIGAHQSRVSQAKQCSTLSPVAAIPQKIVEFVTYLQFPRDSTSHHRLECLRHRSFFYFSCYCKPEQPHLVTLKVQPFQSISSCYYSNLSCSNLSCSARCHSNSEQLQMFQARRELRLR